MPDRNAAQERRRRQSAKNWTLVAILLAFVALVLRGYDRASERELMRT